MPLYRSMCLRDNAYGEGPNTGDLIFRSLRRAFERT